MESPLYEQLHTFVLEEIRSERLKPGDRVPSEKELADQFGVSRITSKKALEILAQERTIERVRGKGSYVAQNAREIVSQLDERPQSQQTVNDRAHPLTVGVIIPDFNDAFGSTLVHAIEAECSSADCLMLLRLTYGRQAAEEEAIRSFVQHGVDGLIVMPVHGEMYNAELLRLVLDNFPLVLVDRRLKGIPAASVSTDNRKAAQELTEFLLVAGHEHIAFISPPQEHTSTIEDRVQGFLSALSGRGLSHNPNHLLTTLMSTLPSRNTADQIRSDKALIAEFIYNNPEIGAIIACEYNIALILTETLVELGRRVPEDCVVACFDSPGDPFGNPPFTHIQQNEAEMGRKALNLLLQNVRGQSTPVNVTAEHQLISGLSTQRLPTITR